MRSQQICVELLRALLLVRLRLLAVPNHHGAGDPAHLIGATATPEATEVLQQCTSFGSALVSGFFAEAFPNFIAHNATHK